ncbi:sigma-70 family RNA polymerase sigma factor [Paenarthrobacter sp. S56]|uniref:RNA polymerase sigma factor n=1 Tax=Paenarthrobacter sp. S56 TaxID=3138179 RepID=UPI00321A872A
MRHKSKPPDREQRFSRLYESVYADLHRFVQRRAHPDVADDVVADTFLAAWRRYEAVPSDPGDARAWLFGIARNILLNVQRGEQRRQALGVRLAVAAVAKSQDEGMDIVLSRVDLGRAWCLLSEVHQEALGLAIFEDLNATQAGMVLGISPVAFRLRLSRARRTLRLLLEHVPPQPAAAGSELMRTTLP